MTSRLRSYPAYKPSGVEWLGDVPEHWDARRGGWLFNKMDRPVRDADEVITCFRDGTVTLRKNRRTEGFTESLKEIGYQGVRKGDLVIHQMDAFAGAVGVSDSDGKGTPVYSVCHRTQDADPLYYAHVVREMARNQWILALAKGIRERSTDFRYSEFAKQALPVPLLPEQHAIVRYLDHVDRRIRRYVAAKRKLIALLEEEKQAVVNRAVTRGLDPNVRLKPSGVEWLGDVPEHWEMRRLRTVVEIRVSNVDKHTRDDEIPIRLCNYVDAYRNDRITSAMSFMSATASQDEIERFRLERDDVMITKDSEAWDDIGVPALVVESADDLLSGYHLALLRPSKQILGAYLVRTLQSKAVAYQFHVKANGVTRYGLTHMGIQSVHIPLPPPPEQRAIGEYLDKAVADIKAAIARAQRQIELLQEYRTRVIADVVTGKLDVREASAQLPDEDDEEAPIDGDGLMADNMDEGSSDVSQLLEEGRAIESEVTV